MLFRFERDIGVTAEKRFPWIEHVYNPFLVQFILDEVAHFFAQEHAVYDRGLDIDLPLRFSREIFMLSGRTDATYLAPGVTGLVEWNTVFP